MHKKPFFIIEDQNLKIKIRGKCQKAIHNDTSLTMLARSNDSNCVENMTNRFILKLVKKKLQNVRKSDV
jgi:hypothetical protein